MHFFLLKMIEKRGICISSICLSAKYVINIFELQKMIPGAKIDPWALPWTTFL